MKYVEVIKPKYDSFEFYNFIFFKKLGSDFRNIDELLISFPRKVRYFSLTGALPLILDLFYVYYNIYSGNLKIILKKTNRSIMP